MTDSGAGTNSVMQWTQASQATMNYRLPSSLRIPSFVKSCAHSLLRSDAEESARSVCTSMRTAARVDANQSAIVKALRSVGAFVQPLHTIGDGCVDLLVAYRGRWYVIEVKDGSKPPSQRKLTKEEQKWHEKASRQAPVFIAESAEDALIVIGAMKEID